MRALRIIAAVAGALACVVGAAAEAPLVGPALVAAMLVAHSATLAEPLRQFRPVLLAGILGTLSESAWIWAGAYAPIDAMRGTLLCPLWITALWLDAAVIVQGAFQGRRPTLPAAAAVGAAVMPACYALAAWLGAIFVAWPPFPALAAAAAYGAVVAPATVWLIRGRESRSSSSHESAHV